jgi:site-specific DNA-methyltransferase (adenine-specific)
MRKREYTNRFVNADAVEFMRLMPDNSVDLIFTSPPDLTEVPWFNQKSMGATVNQYEQFQTSFTEEFCRVVKPTGFIVISQTDRKLNGLVMSHFTKYVEEMRVWGFNLKDQKIMVKRPPVGRVSLFRFTYQMMGIWTVNGSFPRKGEFLKDIIVDNENVYQHKGILTWTQHLCQLVVESLTKPGDLVMDPFAATGPVCFAAQKLGREYLGIEIDQQIFREARAHLKKGDFPE